MRAIHHHRDTLRDALDTLDKQLRAKFDAAIAASNAAVPHTGTMTAQEQEEYIDSLHKRIQRLQVKSSGLDEILAVYRRGILGLYPDGATYGAAQYGGFHRLVGSRDHHSNQSHSLSININVHWIEKEITDVRNCYEEELRLYEVEVSDLRSRLRQSNSYSAELRRRFEDNVKTIYRANKTQNADEIVQHVSFLNASLDQLQSDLETLQQSFASEKLQYNKKHSVLVEDIIRSLQARDVAVQVVNQLDAHATASGINLPHIRKVRRHVDSSVPDITLTIFCIRLFI